MYVDIKKQKENKFNIYNLKKEKFFINLDSNIFYKYGYPLNDNKIKIYLEKNSENGIILKNIFTQIFKMFEKKLKIGNIFIEDESNYIQIIVNLDKNKTKIIETYENYFNKIIDDKLKYLKQSILKRNLENIILEFDNICIEDNFIWINITIDSVKINPNINNLIIKSSNIDIKKKDINEYSKFTFFKYNYSNIPEIKFFNELKIFLDLDEKEYIYSEKLFDSFLIKKNKINPFIDKIKKKWSILYENKDDMFDFYNQIDKINNEEYLELNFERSNNNKDYSFFKNLYIKNNNKINTINNCYSKNKLRKIFEITNPYKIELVIKPFIIKIESNIKNNNKLILRITECIINHDNNMFDYNKFNCVDTNNVNLKLCIDKFPCILKHTQDNNNKILNILTDYIKTSNIEILYETLSLKTKVNNFDLSDLFNQIYNELKKNDKDIFIKNNIYKKNIYLRLSKDFNSKDLNVYINNSRKNYLEKNISKVERIIKNNDLIRFKICFYIKNYNNFYKNNSMEKKNFIIIPIVKEILIDNNTNLIYKIKI